MKEFAEVVSRVLCGLLVLVALSWPAARPEARAQGAAAVPVNGAFDAAGTGVPGWQVQGGEYATADLVPSTESAPNMLHVKINAAGSSGDKSFMLFQVIADRGAFAGRQVRFGARVRTNGAGVNLLLFTPEGSANAFEQNPQTGGFVDRTNTFTVPANASMLSFAIQVFGAAGGEAWVDDAFLVLDGPAPTPTKTPATAPGTASAKIKLDATRTERTVSPLLFGMHIEWVENGLGLMDPQKAELRAPVVNLLKPLKIPLLRFPGGIHADYYDWTLGDGPQAKRGTTKNPFNGVDEKHRFGTPEFVSLLRALGADPMITANYGTGTPAMAGAWAKRFAKDGIRPRFWEVGNEIYLSGPNATGPNGSAIYHTPKQYAADFPAYRAAIQKELPDARVGAIAHLDTGAFPLAPAESRNWTVDMLAALTTKADFFSVHNGYAPVLLDDSIDFRTEAGRRKAYQSLFAAALQTRENLDAVSAKITQLSPVNQGAPLAVTEFGPFFGVSNDLEMHKAYVDQSRTLASALYVASVLDVLIGDPRVFLAAYTNPIHRHYGSLITDTDGGLIKSPTYYLYELYRTRFEPRLVATDVVLSPSFSSEAAGISRSREALPDMVAKASLSEDGSRLTVMLVNRSLDTALTTTVEAKGFTARTADCQVLTAETPNAINGPAYGPTVVSGGPEVRPRPLSCTAGPSIETTVPPGSVVSIVAQG